MPVPLTEGKAFHVPCVAGIVVSGMTVGRGAAVVVAAPDFKGIAIANRAVLPKGSPIADRPIQIPLPVEFPLRPRL